MSDVTVNIGSVFKLCEYTVETDSYRLIPNKCSRIYGTIPQNILQKILNINIYVLRDLLQIKMPDDYDRSLEIMSLINLTMQYSKLHNRNMFGYDIQEVITKNMDSISDLLETQFEGGINAIIKHEPKLVEKYKEYGAILQKHITAEDWGQVMETVFTVNNLTRDFSLHVFLYMLNIFYIVFIELGKPQTPEEPSITYEQQHDVIAIRLMYGAIQQLIINEDRNLLAMRQEMASLERVFNFPAKVRSSEDAHEIEDYIYKKIVASSKEVRSVFPFLSFKRPVKPTAESVYLRWESLPQNTQSMLARSLGYQMGEEFTLLPYILTKHMLHRDRVREFVRYMLPMVIKRYIPKETRKNFADFLGEYDGIFEHILFPNRDVIFRLNEQIGQTQIIKNINAFEDGKYSIDYLVGVCMDKGEMLHEIFTKLMKKNKQYKSKKQ